jgi:hypothetical protein
VIKSSDQNDKVIGNPLPETHHHPQKSLRASVS